MVHALGVSKHLSPTDTKNVDDGLKEFTCNIFIKTRTENTNGGEESK